jgi:hypothetical protein
MKLHLQRIEPLQLQATQTPSLWDRIKPYLPDTMYGFGGIETEFGKGSAKGKAEYILTFGYNDKLGFFVGQLYGFGAGTHVGPFEGSIAMLREDILWQSRGKIGPPQLVTLYEVSGKAPTQSVGGGLWQDQHGDGGVYGFRGIGDPKGVVTGFAGVGVGWDGIVNRIEQTVADYANKAFQKACAAGQ